MLLYCSICIHTYITILIFSFGFTKSLIINRISWNKLDSIKTSYLLEIDLYIYQKGEIYFKPVFIAIN